MSAFKVQRSAVPKMMADCNGSTTGTRPGALNLPFVPNQERGRRKVRTTSFSSTPLLPALPLSSASFLARAIRQLHCVCNTLEA